MMQNARSDPATIHFTYENKFHTIKPPYVSQYLLSYFQTHRENLCHYSFALKLNQTIHLNYR